VFDECAAFFSAADVFEFSEELLVHCFADVVFHVVNLTPCIPGKLHENSANIRRRPPKTNRNTRRNNRPNHENANLQRRNRKPTINQRQPTPTTPQRNPNIHRNKQAHRIHQPRRIHTGRHTHITPLRKR
jgi:hypothetical protein